MVWWSPVNVPNHFSQKLHQKADHSKPIQQLRMEVLTSADHSMYSSPACELHTSGYVNTIMYYWEISCQNAPYLLIFFNFFGGSIKCLQTSCKPVMILTITLDPRHAKTKFLYLFNITESHNKYRIISDKLVTWYSEEQYRPWHGPHLDTPPLHDTGLRTSVSDISPLTVRAGLFTNNTSLVCGWASRTLSQLERIFQVRK